MSFTIALEASVAAAALFAVATVAQHSAARSVSPHTDGAGLVRRLLLSPRWLAGKGAAALAVVAQTIALRHGSVSIVMAILTLGILIALLLDALLWRVPLVLHQVLGAFLIVLGVVVIVTLARPEASRAAPTPWRWGAMAVLGAAALAAPVVFTRSRPPAVRAALLAIGGGTLFAIDAGVLKSLLPWRHASLLYAAVYLAIVVAGNVLVQRAFHLAPLRYSLPAMTATEPVAALAVGRVLFQEHFAGSVTAVIAGVAGVVALVAGVLVCGSDDNLPSTIAH